MKLSKKNSSGVFIIPIIILFLISSNSFAQVKSSYVNQKDKTVKELVTKLQQKLLLNDAQFSKVEEMLINYKSDPTEENLGKVKKNIPIISQTDTEFLKEIIITSKGNYSYFCLIKEAIRSLGDGIAQRDAAIMIGGAGATCLVYDGINIVFPEDYLANEMEVKININEDIQTYFKTKIMSENAVLEKGDVIIIGIGDTTIKARLAALNAGLTLINQ